MISIADKFREPIMKMIQQSRKQHVITEENVYQEGNKANLELIYQILDALILPGSRVDGLENLAQLFQLAKEGKSCLLLMEHYSNFDLPALHYLLTKSGHPDGPEMAQALLAIAGFKLNEESPLVLGFAEAFCRIIIYPSRSLQGITDPALLETETRKSKQINMAAMKALTRAKYHGRMILVFPSGTRFRPGVPETKKGVKEIDTYLKSFEYFVPIGITGNVLHLNPAGTMSEDLAQQDAMVYNVGKVQECKAFREAAQKDMAPEADGKQLVVDSVMAELEKLNQEAAPRRQSLLDKLGVKPEM